MAQITITIHDDSLDRVLDAYASMNGYQETVVPDGETDPVKNPVTKLAFFQNALQEKIFEQVADHEFAQNAITLKESLRNELKAGTQSE